MPKAKTNDSATSKPTTKIANFIRSLPGNGKFRFFVLWLTSWLLLMSFLLSEFLKSNNFVEIFPEWLITPSLIHLLVALVIATIVYFSKWPQSFAGKMTSAVLLGLFFVNYDERFMSFVDIIRSFVPILPAPSGSSMAILSLIFIVILSLLSLLIGRLIDKLLVKKPKIDRRNITLGVVVIVGFMFVSQAVKVIPILSDIIAQSSVQAESFGEPETKPTDKPDVYYLIFDRYSSDSALQESLGYDNSNFTDWLSEEGFDVNKNAYSNYPYTALSVSSTMTADYTNELTDKFKNDSVQSHTLFFNLIQQSPVVKAFKDSGYTFHNVGSVYGATAKAPLADVDHMYEMEVQVFDQKKRLRGIEQTTFRQSIFRRFAQLSDVSWWPAQTREMLQPDYTTAQFKTLNNLSREEPGGRFIFSHILLPHGPYFFNADGSYSPYIDEDNIGKTVEQKYLDQVKFINTRIKELVKSIKENSNGEAVILLSPDEGAVPHDVLTDVYDDQKDVDFNIKDHATWPDSWLRMKYGIQQDVYIPKATDEDLSHLSSVNLFRIVLNRYLGYNLDYLPQCHIGLINGGGKEFDQVDITARLDGETSEFCQELVK